MKRDKFQRLTNENKRLLRKLAIEGKSLNEIYKLTGIGKTTVYYNVKKYKPRQWRDMKMCLSWEEKGELVGAFAGDGSYYHKKPGPHQIRYHLRLSTDMKYGKYIKKLLRKINLNPKIYTRPKENSFVVSVSSKQFAREFIKEYLEWEGWKSYNVRLKNKIDTHSRKFLIGFVRGLMTTDGFVEISGVACGSASNKLIENLAEILKKFNIDSKITVRQREPERRNLHLLRVSRRYLERYSKIIGFSLDYKRERLKKIIQNGVARIRTGVSK